MRITTAFGALAPDTEPLEERTVVDALGTGKVVAVAGCGRTETYTQVCTDSILTCAWTR